MRALFDGSSSPPTEALGAQIAAALQPGDVVALSGGLGAGKTTLARAIIAALGHAGEVPSPSFAIIETYDPPTVRLPLVHADFYRLERPEEAEEIGLDDYRDCLAQREQARALYAGLAADCDACISLSAPTAAPTGLHSTGDPSCTVHASLLGIPALSLPVLADEGLPLGLQVAGFVNRDADAFAAAAAIQALL